MAGRLAAPDGSGVAMSVGIGPLVTVEVASGQWALAGWSAVAQFFQKNSPWSYFGLVVAVLALAAGALALVERKLRRRKAARAVTGLGDTDGRGVEELGASAKS